MSALDILLQLMSGAGVVVLLRISSQLTDFLEQVEANTERSLENRERIMTLEDDEEGGSND